MKQNKETTSSGLLLHRTTDTNPLCGALSRPVFRALSGERDLPASITTQSNS